MSLIALFGTIHRSHCIIMNLTQFKIRVCLESAYLTEIENFFVENTVGKGKN